MTRTALILHASDANARQTTIDHMVAFAKYRPDWHFVYHHVDAPLTPGMRQVGFDAILFNYCFLNCRSSHRFEQIERKYREVAHWDAVRIAITMDDCTGSAILDRWLAELNVQVVYTTLADHRDVLFPQTGRKAEFRPSLTAFIDHDQLPKLTPHVLPMAERPIDFGTRVRMLTPNYGRFGMQKGLLAQTLGELAAAAGFRVDVSNVLSDELLGDAWLRFLGQCRFTVGQKGGYGLNDPDNTIRKRTMQFLAENPAASFDEVEQACFPGLDGQRRFAAVSPRLFEAAIMRTCQVLLVDDYLGLLEPMVHYVPLEPDARNIKDVLAIMSDTKQAAEIADRCYQTLVVDHDFSYRGFVQRVVSDIDRLAAPRPAPGVNAAVDLPLAEHFDVVAQLEGVRRRLGAPLAMATGLIFQQFTNEEALRVIGGLAELAESGCPLWDSLVRASAPRRPAEAGRLRLAACVVGALASAGALDELEQCLRLLRRGDVASDGFLPASLCRNVRPGQRSVLHLEDSGELSTERLLARGAYRRALEQELAATDVDGRLRVQNAYRALFLALGAQSDFTELSKQICAEASVAKQGDRPMVQAAAAALSAAWLTTGAFADALQLVNELADATPDANLATRTCMTLERTMLERVSGRAADGLARLKTAWEAAEPHDVPYVLRHAMALELGCCQRLVLDYAAAAPCLRRAYDWLARHREPLDAARMTAAFELASNHWLMSEHSEAIRVLAPVAESQQQTFGPYHATTAATHFVLGLCARAVNDHQRAVQWLMPALSVQAETLGSEHALTRSTLEALASCRGRIGKPASHDRLLNEARQRLRAA